MGELKIVVLDDVEKRFRMKAYKMFGYKKGALSAAAVEAIQVWIKSNS